MENLILALIVTGIVIFFAGVIISDESKSKAGPVIVIAGVLVALSAAWVPVFWQ